MRAATVDQRRDDVAERRQRQVDLGRLAQTVARRPCHRRRQKGVKRRLYRSQFCTIIVIIIITHNALFTIIIIYFIFYVFFISCTYHALCTRYFFQSFSQLFILITIVYIVLFTPRLLSFFPYDVYYFFNKYFSQLVILIIIVYNV